MGSEADTQFTVLVYLGGNVGGCRGSAEGYTWVWLELPLVQILVVVANIQMETLKVDVGKGSTLTVIVRGLGGTKFHLNWHL